jgi:hypothetical protein
VNHLGIKGNAVERRERREGGDGTDRREVLESFLDFGEVVEDMNLGLVRP